MMSSQAGFPLKCPICEANRGKRTALGVQGVSARPRRTPCSARLRVICALLVHVHREGSGLSHLPYGPLLCNAMSQRNWFELGHHGVCQGTVQDTETRSVPQSPVFSGFGVTQGQARQKTPSYRAALAWLRIDTNRMGVSHRQRMETCFWAVAST